MNEAPKEIKVARSLQGPISRGTGVDHPVRPSVRSAHGTGHFDLPSRVPVGVDPRPARGQQFRETERVRTLHHGDARGGIPFGLDRRGPRWHRLVRRWPNTLGWACTGGVGALVIAVVQAVH